MGVGAIVSTVSKGVRIVKAAISETESIIRGSPIAGSESETEREGGIAVRGAAIHDIPAITTADIRIIKAVEVPSISIRTVVVPIVLVVHLFFNVPVFVVFADQHITIVTVIDDYLIDTVVWHFNYRQLRITTG